MSFLGKAKCFVGVHDWSQWDYKGAGHCEQQRRCARCAKSEEQVAHVWPEFAYVADGKCDQRRQCQRCGQSETRKAHEAWTDWVYPKPDDCRQDRACKRCGEHESRMTHVWGAWEFAGPKTCEQVRFCKRCKEGREQKPAEDRDHTWQPEQRIDCHQMRTACGRCGETRQRTGDFHRFSPWGAAPGGAQRRCAECGYVESGPAANIAAGGPAHPAGPSTGKGGGSGASGGTLGKGGG